MCYDIIVSTGIIQSVLSAVYYYMMCSDVGQIPANYVQLVNSQNMEQYE